MNNQLQAILQNKISIGWAVSGSADNALATATKAAIVGKTHIITGVVASYSNVKTGLLQIKDGATVIAEVHIVNSGIINLPNIKTTAGNAVSAELVASGTAGQTGKVNLLGFTI